MADTEVIEILCRTQDLIKQYKLFAKSETDIKRWEEAESTIQAQLNNLYIN